MATLSDSISQIEHSRRQYILSWLLYAVGGAVLALIAITLVLGRGITDTTIHLLLSLAGLFGVLVIAWVCSRAQRHALATHILFIAVIGTVVVSSVVPFAEGRPLGPSGLTIFALFIPLIGATLLLRPSWSFGYAGLALLGYMTVYSLVGSSTGEKSAVAFVTRLLVMSLYFSIVALLAFLAAKGYERLLQLSLRHAEELEQARAGLTTEVAERTRELQQALDDVRERNKTIHQLSVPILPVAEGVLALPLLGLFDHERARLLTEQLLAAIQRTRVHTVLIDITGVPTVDADTAAALVQSAQAVRLLGAEVVLVGIRAEVAGTIVSHGIDVDQLTTLRDLHSGLRYALRLEHTDVASR